MALPLQPIEEHDLRYRLARLMKVRDRSKLADIDRVISKHKGKEETLIPNCVKRYGEEPPPEPFRERVVRFLTAYDPHRVAEADQMVGKYGEAKQLHLIRDLSAQYGQEPDPPTPRANDGQDAANPILSSPEVETQRHRLKKYYSHYCPDKPAADVEKALEKYAMMEGGWAVMWDQLTKKYGPENPTGPPPVQQQQPQHHAPEPAPAPQPAGGSSAEREQQINRLLRYYAKYQPDKPYDQIVANADRYEGNYDQMWMNLTSKYGPEPGPDEQVAEQLPPPANTAIGGGARHGQDSQEARLRRFYAQYCPEKPEEDLQKALAKYEGNYDQMWTILTGKYGPEPLPPSQPQSAAPTPSAAPAPAPAPAPVQDTQEARLRRFYAQYCPEKPEDDIHKALVKYEGNYDHMWTILTGKYGPEPPGPAGAASTSASAAPSPAAPSAAAPALVPDTHEGRLRRFYAQYCPEKPESDIHKALAKYDGNFDQMWTILTGKYGPEPPTPPGIGPMAAMIPASESGMSQRERLIRYYAKYCPEKSEVDVDKALDKYSTAPGGYEQMWETLERKYGHEEQVMMNAGGGSETAWMGPADRRELEKLKKFYAKYVPDKSEEDITAALRKYSNAEGGYNAMWESLEKRYGPRELKPGEVRHQLSQKERLTRYYAKYCPTKTENEVEMALIKYSTAPGGYEQMWQTLERKYGPEDPNAPLDQNGGRYGGAPRGVPASQAPPPQPIQLDLPRVKPTASLIDDASPISAPPPPPPTEARTSTHSASAPHSAAPQSEPSRHDSAYMAPLDNPLLREAQQTQQRATFGAKSSIVHLTLTLFGADYGLYERAPADRRHRFRDALQHDLASNMGISVRYVTVTRLSAGSIVIEVDVELPMGDEVQAIANTLVHQVRTGTFKVVRTKDAYRTSLGGNPVQLFPRSITATGAANASSAGGAGPSKPPPSANPMDQLMKGSQFAAQFGMATAAAAAAKTQGGGNSGGGGGGGLTQAQSGDVDVPPVPAQSIPLGHYNNHQSQFGPGLSATVGGSSSPQRGLPAESRSPEPQYQPGEGDNLPQFHAGLEHPPPPQLPPNSYTAQIGRYESLQPTPAPQQLQERQQDQIARERKLPPGLGAPPKTDFLSSLWESDHVHDDALASKYNPYQAEQPDMRHAKTLKKGDIDSSFNIAAARPKSNLDNSAAQQNPLDFGGRGQNQPLPPFLQAQQRNLQDEVGFQTAPRDLGDGYGVGLSSPVYATGSPPRQGPHVAAPQMQTSLTPHHQMHHSVTVPAPDVSPIAPHHQQPAVTGGYYQQTTLAPPPQPPQVPEPLMQQMHSSAPPAAQMRQGGGGGFSPPPRHLAGAGNSGFSPFSYNR